MISYFFPETHRKIRLAFIRRVVLKSDYKGHWTCGKILFTPNCTAMRLDEDNLIVVVCPVGLIFRLDDDLFVSQVSTIWITLLLSDGAFVKCFRTVFIMYHAVNILT